MLSCIETNLTVKLILLQYIAILNLHNDAPNYFCLVKTFEITAAAKLCRCQMYLNTEHVLSIHDSVSAFKFLIIKISVNYNQALNLLSRTVRS